MRELPPQILIIGGADTGRAPMAAALLGRLAARHGLACEVASAGVVGHDGEQAEPEARAAMVALGLNIDDHQARSLDDALVASASLLIAVDAGVQRVLRARHPEILAPTLGELAGRARNIPDPFRMPVGIWITYAQEIEALLRAALPRLSGLLAQAPPAAADQPPAPPPPVEAPASAAAPLEPGDERLAAVERSGRLLALITEMPTAVSWPGARAQLEAELGRAADPAGPDDLARPYADMLRAMLALCPELPPPARLATLAGAVERLRQPIPASALSALSAELASWA